MQEQDFCPKLDKDTHNALERPQVKEESKSRGALNRAQGLNKKTIKAGDL